MSSQTINTPSPTIGLGATLVVSDGGAPYAVPLLNQPMSIGRASDSTIVLRSPFVSVRHARIEPEGNAHCIHDVGSTNGLLYEGQRIQQHSLRDGDVIRIGDVSTGTFVSLTYYNPLVPRAAQAAQVAESYALDPNDPEITIGRANCDVTLNNPQVSRHHAQIDRQADGSHLLRDMGSANGTFVNGQRISQHSLAKGDIVQIGPFKLVYNVSRLDQYDQRGALRIDARGLSHLVLKDISLSIAPREFVALVGGSGTGKSTLLKALCGYVPASSGTVKINGDDFYLHFDAYRTMLGYVPQDDILHGTLPVERALDYVARLRLPADTSAEEITRRTSLVIDQVEMTPHRQKVVSNLSGGQRKRVSIAAELLAEPGLFFLDEPTSGLDPNLEKKMMFTLRQLADSGPIVMLVTHATANIVQCDHVVFMAAGRVVFFGPPHEALEFFGVTSNDFADIYTRIEGKADPTMPLLQGVLKQAFTNWQQRNPQSSDMPTLAELWEDTYRRSPYYQRYVTDRLNQAPAGPVVGEGQGKGSDTPRVSFLRQTAILTRRYLDLMVRDWRNLLLLLLQAPIIALLLLLASHTSALVGIKAADLVQRDEAKTVVFMLATISVWFGIINAAREIAKESAIFARERLVNLRIGSYLFSKIIGLGLLSLVQSVLVLLVIGFGMTMPVGTGVLLPSLPMGEMFVTFVLSTLAGTALGLLISALAKTPDQAVSFVPLALIPQIVFAGLIFEIKGVVSPLSWFTISRWSLDAFGTSINLNALCDRYNLVVEGQVRVPCSSASLAPDDIFPAAFVHTLPHLLTNWGVLACYSVVCLALTAWLLKRRDRLV